MRLNAIGRIYEHAAERNRSTLEQCRTILLSQFPYMNRQEADALLLVARDRAPAPYRHLVLVAETRSKQVLGLVVASHFTANNFLFLDYIATIGKLVGGGVGGALYGRLRDEAEALSAFGIFFDCLPDIQEHSAHDEEYRQNIARLRFYERLGVRPLTGLGYDAPRSDKSVFLLMYDGLGNDKPIPVDRARAAVTDILRGKASKRCSASYIEGVASTIVAPLGQRPPRYLPRESVVSQADRKTLRELPPDKRIPVVVNEGHIIHHIRERGYLESPVRVTTILNELDKTHVVEKRPAKAFPDKWLREVHDSRYLKFLADICAEIGTGRSRYGDVFPVRNAARLPKRLGLQIGYYCIDTSTPLNGNAYVAARAAVDCALTAAEIVQAGQQLAYALVRPPGHHAERKYFGGFCYLNSTAVAANFLSRSGKVAILDVDYHHGNGQQDIFYERADVYTVSIHGDPEYAYPNFAGFADEVGQGEGVGYNLNLPLPESTDGPAYHKALAKALRSITQFGAEYLVIALGLDIAKGDPTGSWLLSPADFYRNGQLIAGVQVPTLVVQEGGYKNRTLGLNARSFFQGLWDGYYRLS